MNLPRRLLTENERREQVEISLNNNDCGRHHVGTDRVESLPVRQGFANHVVSMVKAYRQCVIP